MNIELKRVAAFAIGSLLLIATVALLAGLVAGATHRWQAAVAGVICLLPLVLTLLLAVRAQRVSPTWRIVMHLAASALRLVLTVGLATAVYWFVDGCREASFLLWLVALYLPLLLSETIIAVTMTEGVSTVATAEGDTRPAAVTPDSQ